MEYSEFKGLSISRLGFGTMRLPLREDKSVDEERAEEMIDYAISRGINYFDTAWPYHGGKSEEIIGRILKKYPRDSYFLADKYPGHQICTAYDPSIIFEKQLEKCGVDHFDFYLLHNVNDGSADVYLDPRWKIIDYFLEQKRLGRIKHLGFSNHSSVETLRRFLDASCDAMEFCQIELNYLDWTLQNAEEKYRLLTERNIPVWVMEPVRGGRLANLAENDAAALKALRPDESAASFAFRWLQALPNVKVVLSGMSSMEQTVDNINTFCGGTPITEEETSLLYFIAEKMKNSLPCTGCRYCVDGCPAGLDIPRLIAIYNDFKFQTSMNISMQMETLGPEKSPANCIGCGACQAACPQGIDIPAAMADFAERAKALPDWGAISRERELELNEMAKQK